MCVCVCVDIVFNSCSTYTKKNALAHMATFARDQRNEGARNSLVCGCSQMIHFFLRLRYKSGISRIRPYATKNIYYIDNSTHFYPDGFNRVEKFVNKNII